MTFSGSRALLLSAQAARRSVIQNTPASVLVNEISLPLNDGMVLAGQRWTYQGTKKGEDEKVDDSTKKPTKKILALHGWLDNCRSFHYLAPHLVSKFQGNAEVVALDLPGHGLSSHKSLDGPPVVLTEGVYYVAEALNQLGWIDKSSSSNDVNDNDNNKISLLGHSMGGGIGLVYSSVFPEHVDKLVMLDIFSPLPGEPQKTASVIRSHIEARHRGPKPNRVYSSLEKAIQTRRITAAKAPGNQSLSLEAATEMVTRAMEAVPGGGYSFRHDTRLLWPSLQYLMPEQIDDLMRKVECPTAIIAAENGWPFKKDRVERGLEILQPSVFKTLPGSHHLHADPNSAEAVLDVVFDFLAEKNMKYVL